MIQSIVAEVGGGPMTKPTQAPKTGVTPVGGSQLVTMDNLRTLMTELTQDRQNQPSLIDTDAIDSSGARGAAAYSKEKTKFETNMDGAWLDFRAKARRMLGRGNSVPTVFRHLITELPFGTMNHRKRTSLMLLLMMDEMKAENYTAVKGYLAQTMRWIVMDLENPKDPLTAWRLTFQPDPVPLISPTRTSTQLDLNNSLLCPAQLTATLGIARDMELITKRVRGTDAPNNKQGGGYQNKAPHKGKGPPPAKEDE